MPIFDVELVTSHGLDCGLAARLADMAGEVFDCPPAAVWVRVRALDPQHYGENQSSRPEGWDSVFVTVLKHERPVGPDLEAEAQALAGGIARICSRDIGRVHVLYEPDAKGRIAFGGKLRR